MMRSLRVIIVALVMASGLVSAPHAVATTTPIATISNPQAWIRAIQVSLKAELGTAVGIKVFGSTSNANSNDFFSKLIEQVVGDGAFTLDARITMSQGTTIKCLTSPCMSLTSFGPNQKLFFLPGTDDNNDNNHFDFESFAFESSGKSVVTIDAGPTAQSLTIDGAAMVIGFVLSQVADVIGLPNILKSKGTCGYAVRGWVTKTAVKIAQRATRLGYLLAGRKWDEAAAEVLASLSTIGGELANSIPSIASNCIAELVTNPGKALSNSLQKLLTRWSLPLDVAATIAQFGNTAANAISNANKTERVTISFTGVGTTVSTTALDMIAIDAGGGHSCGIESSGDLFCWGLNANGQLGNGSTNNSAVPVRVRGIPKVTQVSAGGGSTCALTKAGAVWCWGANSRGQLGDGTKVDRLVPTRTKGLPAMKKIEVGTQSTCGISVERSAWCWGWNVYGRVGSGREGGPYSEEEMPRRVRGLVGVKQISVGFTHHTCAVTESLQASCWGLAGRGITGFLGSSTPSPFKPPAQEILAGGLYDTCILDSSSIMRCYESLSWPNLFKKKVATGITQLIGFVDFQNQFLVCAKTTSGTVVCFPYGVYGTEAPITLTSVPVASMSAGTGHVCAITQLRTAVCWGSNGNGQLGDGTFVDRSIPVAVKAP